ncbi:unnamed protein product [Cuscuta campestris]|uniref:JmjC domain-containing protein n=1 Tax=Cuscuta campestris TaxID=132261 RepID=A0A484MAT6_9ASTE|nr:unnamed protein product [Cuscuta campestris]
MSENDPLPDDLRCNRTDGRQWRCKRRVLDGKKLCDLHYMQGRHRQKKQKVPDSLKFERARNMKSKNRGEVGVSRRKLKRKRCVSEALDEALKRMELKRGDLPLELIRVFLKRQVEKKRQRELKNSVELTHELPNAVMAIPNLPSQSLNTSAGSGLDVKLGSEMSPFSARNFRSKNIEPLPICTMQALPLSRNARKVKRKRCHWCRRTAYRTSVKCSSCKKQFFCIDCIKERHLERLEIKETCPVCRGCCNCRICTKSKPNDINHFKEFDKKKIRKRQLLYYLVHSLLPVLENINRDQNVEVEVEANISGKPHSEVQIQQAVRDCEKLFCCSTCKTSILDYHRSCSNCSFLLCIHCCSDLRERYKSTGDGDADMSCPSTESGGCSGVLQLRSMYSCNWIKEMETSARAALSSNSKSDETTGDENDGAVNSFLMEMAQRQDADDNFLYCPSLKDLQKENFEDFQKYWGKGHPVIVRNMLRSSSELSWDPVFMFCAYLEKRPPKCPKEKEPKRAPNSLDWCEAEIARKNTFFGSLQWQTQATIRQQTVKLRAWLSSHLFGEQFPAHYLEIMRALPFQEYMNPKSGVLNLAMKSPADTPAPDLGPSIYISYGWPEELVGTEFTTNLCYETYDVVNILAYAANAPISAEQIRKIKTLMKRVGTRDQVETTSNSTDHRGKSSLQSEDTEESGLQDVNAENVQLPDAIAKVPFYSADSHTEGQTFLEDSNMLTDSDCDAGSDSDISILCSESIDRLTDSENDDSFLDDSTEKETAVCGAQWDIFRRQDVPKLVEYLRKHSKEFTSSCCYSKKVVHPVLDQYFFLDAYHKLKLKEEFDVQPWTFEQHPGEAVIIPAGCPYQIRQLKSCVNIVLNFLSPENAAECIHLSDEIRLLPGQHKAKRKLMEVKKMALCSVQDAVGEIQDIVTKALS